MIMTNYNVDNRLTNDYISNFFSYMENIIAAMPCWVFWKDSNFVYLGCNDLTARSLKLPSRTCIVGMTDYDFGWSQEVVDAYRKIDEEIVKTGKPQLNFEEEVSFEGSYTFNLLVNKMPIFDDNNRVIGIVGVSVDITEQKRTEKALIAAKEAAELANKLKSEFVLNMEHDIRTPFVGILGMTKILEEFESDPVKKQIITDISSCTQELLDYSCSILDFSEIEDGQRPVLSKQINFKKLMNSVSAIEIPVAKTKCLDFSIKADSNIPNILMGDEYRLKRILINLLSNAIKFTHNGFVRLLVTCLKRADRDIILSFVVEDSGIGIDKTKIDTIYEKFTRLTPSNQGVYKGSGLGLRIVKQFVEDMDGDIEIESVLGEGTRFACTFSFKLPVYAEENDNQECDR
jgi:two-component system aerobic respiration control sensor histidine kinase ArcB